MSSSARISPPDVCPAALGSPGRPTTSTQVLQRSWIAAKTEELRTRILIPLDGSILAESVLRPLETLLKSPSAAVTLLRVADLHAGTSALEWAQGYLRGLQGQLSSQRIAVRTHLTQGDPAEQILGYPRNSPTDLIAMTTQGDGMSREIRGKGARRVVRSSSVPVYLASPMTSAPQHVVVLDDSPEDLPPFLDALFLSRDTEITLVRLARGFHPTLQNAAAPLGLQRERFNVRSISQAHVSELLQIASTADLVVVRGLETPGVAQHLVQRCKSSLLVLPARLVGG